MLQLDVIRKTTTTPEAIEYNNSRQKESGCEEEKNTKYSTERKLHTQTSCCYLS